MQLLFNILFRIQTNGRVVLKIDHFGCLGTSLTTTTAAHSNTRRDGLKRLLPRWLCVRLLMLMLMLRLRMIVLLRLMMMMIVLNRRRREGISTRRRRLLIMMIGGLMSVLVGGRPSHRLLQLRGHSALVERHRHRVHVVGVGVGERLRVGRLLVEREMRRRTCRRHEAHVVVVRRTVRVRSATAHSFRAQHGQRACRSEALHRLHSESAHVGRVARHYRATCLTQYGLRVFHFLDRSTSHVAL